MVSSRGFFRVEVITTQQLIVTGTPFPPLSHLNLTCGFCNIYLTPVFLQQQNYLYSICRFPLYNHELKEWGHVLIENYLLTPPSLDKFLDCSALTCMIFATQTEHTKASMV